MNIRPYLILNGINSTTITGLLVTELPPISKPLVRTQVDVIDGRDGDIVTKLGYSAYDKPVKIGLTQNYNIDEIIKYFDSEGLVTFSNEPDKVYRYAIYEQIDYERLLRFRTADILLHVQPYKYVKDEIEQEFELTESPATVKVFNAGNIYSRPRFSITGSGTVNLALNGAQVLVIDFGETSQTITIDLEEMNAYYNDNSLANRAITGNYDNINLNIGSNTFTITGSATSFKIKKYSRWI